MSRIGKQPIAIPSGVTVTINDDHTVTVALHDISFTGILIILEDKSKLFLIAFAGNGFGGFSCPVQCRKKHCRKNGNDGNNHQQFNKGEPDPVPIPTGMGNIASCLYGKILPSVTVHFVFLLAV